MSNLPRHILFLSSNGSKSVIYQDVQKCGCTSMRRTIINWANYATKTNIVHKWQEYPHATTSDEFLKIAKFTFIRPTIDRLVSCYREKVRNPTFESRTHTQGIHNSIRKWVEPRASFTDFIEAIKSIPDSEADNHFRSYHSILTHYERFKPPLHIYDISQMSTIINTLDMNGFAGISSAFHAISKKKANVSDVQEGISPKPSPDEISKNLSSIKNRYKCDDYIFKLQSDPDKIFV